jgi:hypothetical protein
MMKSFRAGRHIMGTITLENIYFIGQTVAAIAIVVSLIYVGIQVRQNTFATLSASAQAYVSADNETVGLINSSPDLADILHRGANGLSALNGGDLIRFMAFHDLLFISFQAYHLQWRRGTLDEALWVTYRQAIVDLLQQRGQQDWWEKRRHWFNPEFQDYVDASVKEGAGKPMHPGAVEA